MPKIIAIFPYFFSSLLDFDIAPRDKPIIVKIKEMIKKDRSAFPLITSLKYIESIYPNKGTKKPPKKPKKEYITPIFPKNSFIIFTFSFAYLKSFSIFSIIILLNFVASSPFGACADFSNQMNSFLGAFNKSK